MWETPITQQQNNLNRLLFITLNINGLNSPIKRHRIIDWIGKQDLSFCCIQEKSLTIKDRHQLLKLNKQYKQAHNV